jgi:hypothetical protein
MNLHHQNLMAGPEGLPEGSPMNLTCTSKTAAGDGTTTYTILLQISPNGTLQPPAGSTAVVAADPNVTYTFSGTLPNGHEVDIQVNGAGVLVYSTP